MSITRVLIGLIVMGLLLSISASSYSTPVYPTNIALGMTVTGSASYDISRFKYEYVVDGSIADSRTPYNYWVLPNSTTGWVQINLGREYNLGKIEFLNTHNAWFNDRTTKDWSIEIFRSDFTKAFEFTGTEPDLNPANWTDPIPPKIIDLAMPVTGRYVKFSVNSYWGYSGGLNELRVYEAMPIPEPSTFFMLGAGLLGLIGYAYKRNKN